MTARIPASREGPGSRRRPRLPPSLSALYLCAAAIAAAPPAPSQSKPNFLVFIVDDMGYADLESFGATNVSTPATNRLAREGLRLTQWLSAASVCTPSRAALQTGRLARRLGMTADTLPIRVLSTISEPGGLPSGERTIATELKELGYRTGMSGKWHLGMSNETAFGAHLPPMHGYDSWLGIPFTNMHACAATHLPAPSAYFCLLMANTTVVQQPFAAQNMTSELTRHALDFLEWGGRQGSSAGQRRQPFFFMFNFLHVHTPLFSAPAFTNVSAGGKFGDNVEEMDDAVGQVLAKLDELGLANDTLVLLTSDNGPFAEEGWDNVGRVGGLAGSKGQTWEGGIRMPGLARWPGRIAAGAVTDALVGTLDVFPTLLALAGGAPRADRVYDGADMAGVLFAPDPAAAPSAHDFMWHYCGNNVTAARHVVKTTATAADGTTTVSTRTLKLHFATQVWKSDKNPSPLCVQCCPNNTLHSKVGSMCECDVAALTLHVPPLIFDMDLDRNESSPLRPELFPGGRDAFHAEVELVRRALADHYATITPAPDQMRMLPNNSLQPCCTGGPWDANACLCDTYAPGQAYP